jgi:hypothetical protein
MEPYRTPGTILAIWPQAEDQSTARHFDTQLLAELRRRTTTPTRR